MVAVKSCFAATEISIVTDCELVCVSVSLRNNKKITIASFYRPPSSGIEPLDQLHNVLSVLRKNSTVILGGDFNCGDIDWQTNTIASSCNNKQLHERLLDLLSDHCLEQMQRDPTRLGNILDLYCTNRPGLVKYSATIPGISDHDIIVVDSSLKPEYTKKKNRKIYLYSKADWNAMKDEISNFADEFIANMSSLSIDNNWGILKNQLQSLLDKYVPSKRSIIRQHLPWVTTTIKRMCRKKQRLYNKARKSGRSKHWDRFNQFKRDTRRAIRSAHNNYINNILAESLQSGETQTFWRYVKAQQQDSCGVAPLRQGGELHSSSEKKAEILSQQFMSVFTKEDGSATPQLMGPSFPDIPPLLIMTAGVRKLLANIKTRKASGPDNIAARVLKELADPLAPCLAAFFSLSLQRGEVPMEWKTAFVAPIFKKGSKQLPENYRPVSLTCICSKLLEHVVCHHIINHLETHGILTSLQHGFRSGHSCESQLLTTLQDFVCNFDKKTQIDVVVLDFAKAFDTVPHNRLLGKLRHYGINGMLHLWISSFLKGRTQSVVVEGVSSSSVAVESGVPQGTVIGPLLFLLYINDLPNTISSKVRLFADDCLLYREINSLEDQQALQQDLFALEKWCLLWGMRFNTSKCEVMNIHRGRGLSHMYTLSGDVLHSVNKIKYLGICITDNLSWSRHISAITAKGNQKIGFLWRNLLHCPRELREQAYFAVVRSVLEYSAAVWDPHRKGDILALEKVQRRAARFVTGDSSRTSSVTAMLEGLGWKSLRERRRDIRLATFYKAVHSLTAIPTENILVKADERTRSAHPYKFRQIKANTETYRQSFFPRTIPEWNSQHLCDVLPPTSKHAASEPHGSSELHGSSAT